MKEKGKLRNLLSKYNIIVLLCIILTCEILYVVIPRLFISKPIIYTLTPEVVMENSDFNSTKSITFDGENFDHLVAIYINGVWEPECEILSQTEDMIQIMLPLEYYREEKKINIQVQTKINSDLFAMSNKMEFEVLSDNDIKEPKINSLNPNVLSFEKGIIQKITIDGENFNKSSVVMINDIAVKTSYMDHTLTVSIPFWEYYKENKLKLKVVQYYDGYATSVESFPFYLDVNSYIMDAGSSEEDFLQNEQIMMAYLKMLKNDDYVVIFSVKDESSCAMTDEIIAEMSNLGLKENLKEAGPHNSYIAILDGSNLVYEAIGKDALTYDCDLVGAPLHVESANFNVGDCSIIKIGDTEYSVNNRGLNIVVYSKSEGCVIDRVSFDTYDGLTLTK